MSITEEEFEETLKAFDKETADCIRLQRKQLTERGITKEPLRTQMACEFADAILSSRRKDGKR